MLYNLQSTLQIRTWANPPGRTEFSAQVRTRPVGVCCHKYELAVREAASVAWMESFIQSQEGPRTPQHLGVLETGLGKAESTGTEGEENPVVGAKGLCAASPGLAPERGKCAACHRGSGFRANLRLNELKFCFCFCFFSALQSTVLKEKHIQHCTLLSNV